MAAAVRRRAMGTGLLLAAACAAGLAGCDRPDWTDPARSKGPHTILTNETPATPGAAPRPPAWATGLIGESLTIAFPRRGACTGNTDAVLHRYAGPPAGVEIIGWGWDGRGAARVERVLLVDPDLRIVGAGDGGRRRADVPRALPAIHDENTGWLAITLEPSTELDTYGVVDHGRTVCRLGHIAL
jgi:hypothetical protein